LRTAEAGRAAHNISTVATPKAASNTCVDSRNPGVERNSSGHQYNIGRRKPGIESNNSRCMHKEGRLCQLNWIELDWPELDYTVP
jgi:hypothetical protein